MTLALPLAPAMRVYWMRTSAIAAFKTQCMQCYLSSSELQRMQRLIFENDKLDFLASRVLLRGVLAQLQGCSPHEVAFGTSPFGKPHLVNSGRSLEFNLSHTRRASVLAVCDVGAVGIDIEWLERPAHFFESLVEMTLTRRESHWLAQVATDSVAYRQRFLGLWTAKEALLKWEGSGLTQHDIRSIEILPDADGRWHCIQMPAGSCAPEGGAGLLPLASNWVCSWAGSQPSEVSELSIDFADDAWDGAPTLRAAPMDCITAPFSPSLRAATSQMSSVA